MKKTIFLIIYLLTAFAISSNSTEIPIKDIHGSPIGFYKESHALLIGVNNYQKTWPHSERNINAELDMMEQSLIQEDFHIIKVINPTSSEMIQAVKNFIEFYGFHKNNRLVVFYSGYSQAYKKKEYLIPVDLPGPELNQELIKKAISINQILSQMQNMKAAHVIFILNTCISNTIPHNTAQSDFRSISSTSLKPVRELISAGSAGQKFPDKDFFISSIINALSGSADINGDQYVTGSELAAYINKEMIDLNTGLTPQYGKTGNGDFIFQVVSSGKVTDYPSESDFNSTLSVSAEPGARVFLDGWNIGKTPLKDFLVPPGRYFIQVEHDCCIPYKKWVDIKFDKAVSLSINMRRKKEPKSLIFIKTIPEDTRINILSVKEKFYQGFALIPGRYQVEFSAANHKPRILWMDVTGKKDVNLEVRLEKYPGPPPDFFENSLGMKFKLIEPGNFIMGSPASEKGRNPDEIPHNVILTNGFYIGLTEVSQSQWGSLMGNNPSFFKNCGQDCPVEYVSWEDCQKFIEKLNRQEATNTYRLPTEAEWEYACRAGNQAALHSGPMNIGGWNFSIELSQVAWYGGNSCVDYVGAYNCSRWPETQYNCGSCGIHPGAKKQPNEWGLYDMHGNLYEWCQDIYNETAYEKHSEKDPIYLEKGPGRVVRGGSWTHYPWLCRSANRDYYLEKSVANYIGFRLVKDVYIKVSAEED
ncbi:Sulphatase-modifying factor domain protein [Candidatus Magnetomoraceae bacterium gMMP-1]